MQTEWTRPRRCICRVDRVGEFLAKELDRRLPASPPGIEITGDYRSAVGIVQISARSERVDQCGCLPPPRFERTAVEQGKSRIEMHVDEAEVPSPTRSARPSTPADDGDTPLPLERQLDQVGSRNARVETMALPRSSAISPFIPFRIDGAYEHD